jgi:hypothetical protein
MPLSQHANYKKKKKLVWNDGNAIDLNFKKN